MPVERRLKRFLVPLSSLGGFLRGTAVVVDRRLPADAELLFAHWDAEHGSLIVTVHSGAYPTLLDCQPIPIDNAPIVAEDRCSS